MKCVTRYIFKNAEKIKEYQRSNAEKIKEYQRSRHLERNHYQITKRRSNVQFRLSGNLRSRIGEAIRRQHKVGSSIKCLGCTISDFKQHIEQQWLSGMSWKNYGRAGWHLDHIVPLASFDLTNKEQFLKACHYTNYQPLWALDNLRKRDKI